MKQLTEEAFERLNRLPQAEQERYARQLLSWMSSEHDDERASSANLAAFLDSAGSWGDLDDHEGEALIARLQAQRISGSRNADEIL